MFLSYNSSMLILPWASSSFKKMKLDMGVGTSVNTVCMCAYIYCICGYICSVFVRIMMGIRAVTATGIRAERVVGVDRPRAHKDRRDDENSSYRVHVRVGHRRPRLGSS